MKKLITNSLKLIGITTVFYILVFTLLYCIPLPNNETALSLTSDLMKQGNARHATASLNEFDQSIGEVKDFVVLGSSQAYRGYDPRIFKEAGYDIHNLGTSSQRYWQTELLVKELLDSTVTKNVILDIYIEGFSDAHMESTGILIQNVKDNMLAFKLAYESQDIRSFNLLSLRASHQIFDRYEYKSISYGKVKSKYISGGFAETFDTLSSVDTTYSEFVSISNAMPLKRIVEYLVDKNIGVYLVFTPISPLRDVKNYDVFKKVIEEMIKGIDEVTIINASNLKLDGAKHFYDYRHLNQKGVKIFNNWLIQTININE